MSFGEQLIAWRRELHQNPELSGQEVETTARLRQWLTNAGIAPQPYDLSTGLVAEIGTGSRMSIHVPRLLQTFFCIFYIPTHFSSCHLHLPAQ